MIDRTSCALVRLTVLAVAVLLAAFLACRPAWSPDGRKVLFPVRDGESMSIALHDRDTGKTTIVFTPPKGRSFCVPLWTPDGKHAVILAAENDDKKVLRVTTFAIPKAGEPKTFVLETAAPALDYVVMPPVIEGHRLFCGGSGILRIDLDTGEQRVAPEPARTSIAVVRRGPALCYVTSAEGDDTRFELGTLDPDTLAKTPLFTQPADLPWRVQTFPSFSSDLSRVAFPAHSLGDEGEVAILVFADGKLETVLPVGARNAVELCGVAWGADPVTLVAGVCRRAADDEPTRFAVLETSISGSVTRETPVFPFELPASKRLEGAGVTFGVALSPDGKTAAFATAMLDTLPKEQHGLYLVDLAGKERKVTHVPCPRTERLRIAGSDTMLELAAAWDAAFLLAHADVPTLVSGGGSGVGFKMLLDGECDLAMSSRPAKPAELEAAKKNGSALVEHRVVFDALAICVHKGNSIASITMAQLAQVFGDQGVTRWSELRVMMPAEHDAITRVGRQDGAGAYQLFREIVLGKTQFHPRVTNLNSSPDIVRSVARVQGAIGYVDPLGADDTVKLLPVADKPGAAAVLPTPATIADGTYPLARPLFLYSRSDSKPQVAQFLAWLASDAGRQATEKVGFFAAR